MPAFRTRAAAGPLIRSAVVAATLSVVVGCVAPGDVERWGIFEAAFVSAEPFENALQDRDLFVTFTSPSAETRTVRGFWDGGTVWRVRFSPGEEGDWTYATRAIPQSDSGLHGRTGRFHVSAASGDSRFARHGPVRVSAFRTFLEHADGTPFFWMADTGWNAALLATPDEFDHYADERARQGFTAVQWVATQWRASPEGDRLGDPAFTGREHIVINPAFFQRLDTRAATLARKGLLNVPVLLWAVGGGSNPAINPGVSLPEDQAIRLAQYMVARWQGYSSVWILGGDGDYRGDRAERWKRIGRGVFGDEPHAPVVMHPGGMQWAFEEFRDEAWIDVFGYQSGHGDDDRTLRWITEGPPSRDWTLEPHRPFINLEPPYEHHVAYQSKQPIPAEHVRRAVYWSLLNAPTAGVTYGGHGVWGWDDGSGPPTDHAGSGTPLPWREAIVMPGAEQMKHVADAMTAIEFWRLRPAPEALVDQPGADAAARFISVAASADHDLLVAYTPDVPSVVLQAAAVPEGEAVWVNPRSGERSTAAAAVDAVAKGTVRFDAPGEGDWLLILSAAP